MLQTRKRLFRLGRLSCLVAAWCFSAVVTAAAKPENTAITEDEFTNAAENEAENAESDTEEANEAHSNAANPELELATLPTAPAKAVRRFHEVLDELLAEFGYDVKLGQIKGLKNLAIRKVEVSAAIPTSYRTYMEYLISERIRENSSIRLIHCVPCMSKTSRMIAGKIVITSPSTNLAELRGAAETLGIENFMDVVLVYHSTHMVLALQIFKPDSSELVWSRTYNSETIRSRYQKLAIDYSQVAKSRPGEDYQPEYRLLVGVGGATIPNVGGSSRDESMLSLQFRSTEKFDNRHSEFGMQLGAYLTLASVITDYPSLENSRTVTPETPAATESTAEPQPAPFSFAMTILGLYSHNFLGSVESYNEVRQGLHFGLGGLLTTGFLAPVSKIGWDMYFGRRFTFSISGVYITASQIVLDNVEVKTRGGLGGEGVLSLNF